MRPRITSPPLLLLLGARGDVSDITREREGDSVAAEEAHRDRSISASPTSSLIRRFQSLNHLAGAVEEPKDNLKVKEEVSNQQHRGRYLVVVVGGVEVSNQTQY